MRKRILVTHELPGNYVEELKKKYEVEVWKKRDIPRNELLERVKGVDGIISLLTEKIDKEVMEAAGNNLKVISNYAVGYDNIDVKEATLRGIVVTNTPGVLTEAVAEHVMALMLSLLRKVVEGDRLMRAGKYHGWEPDLLVGSVIRGKTFGVIGLGRIGKWVCRLAVGLGMKVIYYSRTADEEFELILGAKYVSMNKLLKEADVVSLHVPLTKETEGMIGATQLRIMKKTAILINTARGRVVNEDALIEALDKGNIGGAALDVFTNEENVNPKLLRAANTVLTPHIASATDEARLMMARLATKGMSDALTGKRPENLVNEDVWQKRD